MKPRHCIAYLFVTAFLLLTAQAWAVETQQGQITDLDTLLESVRQQQLSQRELNEQREQAFLADKEGQQARLDRARKAFEQSQSRNQPLLVSSDVNKNEILRLESQLQELQRR